MWSSEKRRYFQRYVREATELAIRRFASADVLRALLANQMENCEIRPTRNYIYELFLVSCRCGNRAAVSVLAKASKSILRDEFADMRGMLHLSGNPYEREIKFPFDGVISAVAQGDPAKAAVLLQRFLLPTRQHIVRNAFEDLVVLEDLGARASQVASRHISWRASQVASRHTSWRASQVAKWKDFYEWAKPANNPYYARHLDVASMTATLDKETICAILRCAASRSRGSVCAIRSRHRHRRRFA
jgi:hypothetical protein